MKPSQQLRAVAFILGAGLFALLARDAVAATAAYDNACNDSIATGNNGGTGFGTWTLTTAGGGLATLTSSTGNGASPGVNNVCDSKAWGLFAGGGTVGANYAFAVRPFTAGGTPTNALQVDQTFTVDYEIGGVDGSGGVEGFALFNSSGQTIFYLQWNQGGCFEVAAGGTSYSGTCLSSTPGFTESGARVAFTLTSPTAYTLVMTVPTNGTAYTNSGLLVTNQTGGYAISQVQLFANGSGSTGYGNTYEDYDFFNNMGITCPTMTLSAPANVTVCSSGNASFYIAVTNGSAPVYQWLKGGVAVANGGTISGANTTNLVLTGVRSGDNSTAWSCAVTNACGTVVTSASATLTVASSVSITNQPSSATACSGSSASFTVGASGASSYQWYVGPNGSGTALSNSGATSGVTSATLTLSSATASTNFYVVVSGCGSPVTSSEAALTIGSAPSISTQPTSQSVCSNSTATFTVTASGSPLNYVWRKRGTGWGTNAWAFTAGGGGFFIASSSDNGGGSGTPNIDSTNSAAWGLYNNAAGGATTAIRSFPSALQVGQQFQIQMDNGYVTTGNSVGFSLLNASGNIVWEFFFTGGGTTYYIHDNASLTNPATGTSYTEGGLQIIFTLTSATTYSATVEILQTATTYGPFTGTLVSPTGGSVPAGVRLFNANVNYSGNAANLFFNNIIINGVVDDNAGSYNSTIWAAGQTPNLGNSPLSNGGTVSGSATASLTLTGVGTADSGHAFDVVLTNSCGYVASTSNATLTVNQSPVITSATPLTGATYGASYSNTVTETGGTGPYTYSITSGSLPSGLSIGSSGVITGTPTALGTSSFTVKVADNNGCSGTSNLAITVSCPTITVSPTTLPTVNIGAAYSQTASASGGKAAYTFAITSGALPSGLSLNSTNGFISGTYSGSPGSASFTITATDADGCTGSRGYTVQMLTCPTITVSPSSFPSGTVGTVYGNQTNTASGGTSPYTFTVNTGSLPTGLSLSSSGVLSGTPTVLGTNTFTVLATDTNGCTGVQSYSITINCPTITLSPSSPLTGGTVGTSYSQAITASGGTSPYTYAVTSGTSPTGLTLSSAGTLSGTPSAAGTYNFTVTSTDSHGCTGSQAYSLTITCSTITVSPAASANLLSNLVLNAYFSTNLYSASGGAGTYTFSVSSGALPPGVTVSSAGLISGTPTNAGAYTFAVQATDTNNCTGSTTYNVTVGALPSITTQPSSQTVCSNSTATFSVTASGGAPLAYSWSSRANTGWGTGNQWQLSTGNANASYDGYYISSGDSTAASQSPGIGTAFGLYANNSGNDTAIRSMPPLSPGQSIAWDYQNPQTMNGGINTIAVFGLQATNGVTIFELYVRAGDTQYTIADNANLINSSGIPYTTGGLHCVLTVVDANHYNLIVEVLASGNTYAFYNRTLYGLSGLPIGKIILYYGNADTTGGSSRDFFVNNIVSSSYDDNAGNYSSTFTNGMNLGNGPISGATNSSYTAAVLTPTNTTSYTAVVVSSPFGTVLSSTAGLTVGTNPKITTATPLPGATVGTSYSQTIAASGGTSPYTFSVGSGLPTGLSLSSAGTLSGTPTAAGTYNFTVTVTDSSASSCTGSSNLALTVSCPTVTVTPSTLPSVAIGVPYSQTVSASGGTSPYTYAVTSGALPSGLSLNSTNGLISGTYSGSTGSANFTITATDDYGCTGSRAYTVSEITCPTITLSPSSPLAGGTVGTVYNQTITASGGTGPYTYSVISGSLPTGLSLSSAGTLSGTPTAVNAYSFTVQTIDTSTGCTGSQAYSLTTTCPSISLSALSGGAVGTAYSQTVSASGGTGPYTYAKTSGTLPTGLSLSSSGVLSGTPTAAGTYNFTVTATDYYGCSAGQAYSLTFTCPTITVSLLSVNNSALPFGVSNQTFSATNNIFTASGSPATPYAFTSGTLPGGLSLSSAGVLSGTPTTTNTVAFSVTATDTNGCTGSASYTITNGWAVAITTQPTNTAVCSGSTATFTVAATGTGPLSYSWRKNNTGWGTSNAWQFTTQSGNTCDQYNGFYLGDSTACGGISPGIGITYALYANSVNSAQAVRNFSNLQVGQSVVVDYQNPRDMDTSRLPTYQTVAVFGLQDSSGVARFELYFRGGDNFYSINDANASVNSSGIPYTKNGLQVVFTLTGTDTYNLQVQDLASGKWYTYVNRTLGGTNGNAISQLRFFYENTGTGGTACQDFFFNLLSVGGYSDVAGNYTSGACGTTTWTNGANAGQGPLTDTGSVSGSATPTLTLSNVGIADTNGVYSVIVYNPYGAVKSGTATLTVNPHPNLGLSETDVSCSGGSNGTVTATFSNGTGISGALQLSLDGGTNSTQTSPYTFTGLVAGSHTVAVQDVDSCTSNLTITVNQPTMVGFTTSQTNESCYGQSIGGITVNASGGSGSGYMYSDNNGSTFQAGNQFTGLAAGTYNIVVEDGNGCLSSSSAVTITQPTALSLGLGETDVSCNGGSDGTVTATFSGGTGTLQVNIDSGSYSPQTSPYTFTGLSAGLHTVSVEDANGCTTSQSITVNQPAAPTVTASSNAPFYQGQYQIVAGQTLTLSATTVANATAYNWSRSGGGFSASGQSVSDTPPAGTYTYTVSVPTSCGTAVGTTPSIVVLSADANGVPDSWKTEHGYLASTPDSTVGANGFTLLQSYLAGLDPTNAESVLDLSSASVTPAGLMTVAWQSQQDGTTPVRLYDFYSLTGPYADGGSWSRIDSNIAPAGATTSLSDDASGITQRFYRVTIAGHTDDVATIGIAGVQMLSLQEGANYISMSTTQSPATLLSVLGTNLPQGAVESTATTVDIWDQNSQAFLVNNARYWLSTGAGGWKQHNTAAASNNVQLDPTKGLIVTIRSGQGAQTLYIPGFVPTVAETQTVQSNGYTVASSTYPQPISLIDSELSNAITGGISLNKSDNVLFFDPTTQLFDIRVWYYTGDDSWRNADASIATQEFQPGGAFLIQTRNRSTNLIWTNPVPYAVPLQGP